MRHFHRTHVVPAEVVAAADRFFAALGLTAVSTAARARTFSGPLGTVSIAVKPEGGHYTFVEADTDQMGESRLDKNVKRFFVELHRQADPGHRIEAHF